jgi:hypothetical protein
MLRKTEKSRRRGFYRQREFYRLWFEYLRLAKKSDRRDVKDALKRSATFYAPWGDVLAERFDVWWPKHAQLFEERHVVRRLAGGEKPSSPQSLVVEIPLNQSATKLTRAVKQLIEKAVKELRSEDKRKNKAIPSAQFAMTEGAEPKQRAVREMLTVYRDIYVKNPTSTSRQLLDIAQQLYKSRKQKKWAVIPPALIVASDDEPDLRAERNIRRYVQKAEKVMLNVANGNFPGKY